MNQDPPRYGQRIEDQPGEVPVCPRHPDRPAYVRCSRCGRPVCSSCQVQAPVGVQCVDCVHQAQQAAGGARRGGGAGLFPRAGVLPVTWGIIGVCVVVFLLQVVTGDRITAQLAYHPALTAVQPWRMLTSAFVHGSLTHLLLNMYSLYIVGQALEPRLGSWRYAVVFALSVLGGSAAVYLLSPGTWVVGASGGIFGLFGAFFAWTRFRGGETGGLVVLIAVNLVFGFVVPGISWQAHVGGLIVGALTALLFDVASPRLRARRRRLR